MSNSDTSSRLQAPAVIVLLLACFSTVVPVTLMNRFANRKVQDQPLDSKATMASDIPTHAGIRSVHAGLWSDPFQGIAKPTIADSKPTDTGVQPANPPKSDDYIVLLEKLDDLRIVAVIVPGENTATEIEDRTNYRHAVEQALANEGYSMDFPGRMSFVAVNWKLKKNGTSLSHRSEVPLKLYRKESEPNSGLLVCWIDRRFLGDKPLAALDNVLLQIDSRSNRKTIIVGPMFSSELTSMAEEAKALEVASVKLTNWTEWSIVSPAATNKDAQDLAVKNLTSCGFYSTIGNDDRIAEKLVQEIGSRRLHLGNIVIFSEAGATSPRGLKASLEKMLLGKTLNEVSDQNNGENADTLESPLATNPTSSQRIRSFEYLRGIGSVQKDGSTRVDDYFLRKLDSVVTDEQDLSPSSVSAVIVLGDEVYDKVKLIEIAKASFQNATCLTHDLSYLYSTPDNIAFCRGLLVASHGGLSVKEDLDQVESGNQQSQTKAKETFEFRDVYQRSYYQAMTYALDGGKSENRDDSVTTIFEIGLQHPIKIEPGSTKVRWWNLVMFTFTGISALVLFLFSIDYLRADRLRIFKDRLFAPMRANEAGLAAFTLIETNVSLTVIGAVVYQQLRMYTSTFAYVVQVLMVFILLCIISRAIVLLFRNNAHLLGFKLVNRGTKGFGMTGYLLLVLLSTVVCMFVILEILDKHGLQLEPLDALSGISVWPSVAAFVIVIALCLDWLRRFGQGRLAWKMKGDDLDSLFPSLSPKMASEQLPTSRHPSSNALSIQELNRIIVERTPHAAEKTTRPTINRFSVDAIARFMVLGLLLCVFGWQFDDAYRHGLWSLIPLPPARGAIAISLGLFLGTLSLLLCLKMSVTAWYQFFVFRRFARCIRETWKDVHDGRIKQRFDQVNAVQDLYWACDFLQAGSYWLVRNALWHPSLVLLLFAISRMPMFETWQVNSETVLLVAGIPVVLGLISSFLVRAECRKMRDMCGRILLDWTVDPTIVYASNAKVAETEIDAKKRNEEIELIKAASKDTKGKIELMNQGAFVSLWNDPVVGSILAIATAMASGPGKGVLDFFLRLFA